MIERMLIAGVDKIAICCVCSTQAERSKTMNVELSAIEIGSQVYLKEGGDPFGGIRDVRRSGRGAIVIYVENSGEFVVPAGTIQSAHDGKVVLDSSKLDPSLESAIAHAHDREEPGL
jgi:hypothetical protein